MRKAYDLESLSKAIDLAMPLISKDRRGFWLVGTRVGQQYTRLTNRTPRPAAICQQVLKHADQFPKVAEMLLENAVVVEQRAKSNKQRDAKGVAAQATTVPMPQELNVTADDLVTAILRRIISLEEEVSKLTGINNTLGEELAELQKANAQLVAENAKHLQVLKGQRSKSIQELAHRVLAESPVTPTH